MKFGAFLDDFGVSLSLATIDTGNISKAVIMKLRSAADLEQKFEQVSS